MTTTDDDALLETRRLSKYFGSVIAIKDISMLVRPGTVPCLLGDNGAGKSTLIKILTGFLRPDSGEILVNGQPVELRSVGHARELGIETVYQDLALVDELPVYLNLHLNKELVHAPLRVLRKQEMRRRARRCLDDMGINIPSVNAEVADLSGGQRQAIAVARSVYSDAKVLLLDEPLAAMGAKEGGIILRLIKDLKERGEVSLILIAHNYAHVLDVCDRVALLQHGRISYDKPTNETSMDALNALVAAEYRMPGNGAAAAT
jgi:ABC-type sugar transport system ATPase subunit